MSEKTKSTDFPASFLLMYSSFTGFTFGLPCHPPIITMGDRREDNKRDSTLSLIAVMATGAAIGFIAMDESRRRKQRNTSQSRPSSPFLKPKNTSNSRFPDQIARPGMKERSASWQPPASRYQESAISETASEPLLGNSQQYLQLPVQTQTGIVPESQKL